MGFELPSLGQLGEMAFEGLTGSEFAGDVAKTLINFGTGNIIGGVEGLIDGGENILGLAGSTLGGMLDGFANGLDDHIFGTGASPSPESCPCTCGGYSGVDESMASVLESFANKGTITAEDIARALVDGAGDFDGQAAGLEFKQLAEFVNQNLSKLTDAAKEAFGQYSDLVSQTLSSGETGIQASQFDNLVNCVKEIAQKETEATQAAAGNEPAQGADGGGKAGGADKYAGLSLDELIFRLLNDAVKEKREELKSKAEGVKGATGESKEEALQEMQFAQQQLQQMNQLLTNMMSSIHQMNQAIIQNIR